VGHAGPAGAAQASILSSRTGRTGGLQVGSAMAPTARLTASSRPGRPPDRMGG